MADNITLSSNYAGVICSFSQDELNAAAAQIQQQYAGNNKQMLADFKQSLLPREARGAIPNADNVPAQIELFVNSLIYDLTSQGVDMNALVAHGLGAAQLVEQANTESARIARQANMSA